MAFGLSAEEEMDATGGSNIEEAISANPEFKRQKVNYMSFDRYKVGFLEDEDRRVVGILSIEIMKDFYDIDQLPEDELYWDEEAYYT